MCITHLVVVRTISYVQIVAIVTLQVILLVTTSKIPVQSVQIKLCTSSLIWKYIFKKHIISTNK